MNKKNLVENLLINLEKKAEESRNSIESARQAVIAAPGAMQSKSDTTKSQMSRLAESYIVSHQQIQRCISALKEVDLSKEYKMVEIGTIVKVKEEKDENYYFILPLDYGSQSIKFEGKEVNAIAAKSPIAQALLNKKVGNVINAKVPAGLRVFRIIEIE